MSNNNYRIDVVAKQANFDNYKVPTGMGTIKHLSRKPISLRQIEKLGKISTEVVYLYSCWQSGVRDWLIICAIDSSGMRQLSTKRVSFLFSEFGV